MTFSRFDKTEAYLFSEMDGDRGFLKPFSFMNIWLSISAEISAGIWKLRLHESFAEVDKEEKQNFFAFFFWPQIKDFLSYIRRINKDRLLLSFFFKDFSFLVILYKSLLEVENDQVKYSLYSCEQYIYI